MYDTVIAGPALDDFVSPRDWFLPVENRCTEQVFAFGTSEDCAACELSRRVAYHPISCNWIWRNPHRTRQIRPEVCDSCRFDQMAESPKVQ